MHAEFLAAYVPYETYAVAALYDRYSMTIRKMILQVAADACLVGRMCSNHPIIISELQYVCVPARQLVCKVFSSTFHYESSALMQDAPCGATLRTNEVFWAHGR